MSYRIETTRDVRGIKDFLELPKRIYRRNPYWVAPLTAEVKRSLDHERNPYFRESFERTRTRLYAA